MTLPASEMFSVLGGPQYGVVYRGISFDPVPEPGTIVLLGSALAGLAAVRRRKRALCALPQIEVVADQLVVPVCGGRYRVFSPLPATLIWGTRRACLKSFTFSLHSSSRRSA